MYVLSEWSLSKNKLFIRRILYQVSTTMKVQLWPIDMFVKNNKWKILLMELIHKNEYLHEMHMEVTSKNKLGIKHYDLNF